MSAHETERTGSSELSRSIEQPKWCEKCVRLHWPGCQATHQDSDGHWVCVFCLDGVPCPGAKQKAKKSEHLSTADLVKHPVVATGSVQEDRHVDSKPAKRICKVTECVEELGATNKSGYCATHRHLGDPRRKSSAPVSSRSAPVRKNGAVSVRNGTASSSQSTARVDQFFIHLCDADKLRIIEAWFANRV
jgi:hypothetical protein